MFAYYLRLATKSIRRNPYLSLLMMLAIALGIGACMTTITVNYIMSSNPIPHKSDDLYYVQLDSWDPYSPFREPNEPPDQLTWRDATNLMEAKRAHRQTAMATSGAVVEPADQDINPFMASLRLNFSDFFPMFDTPFLYGSGWGSEDDNDPAYVVVISKDVNDRVFGGENSVGRTLTVAGKPFRVVGVLDTWIVVPRFYDVTTNAFQDTADIFMPFYMKRELELPNSGNTNCWKSPEGEGFTAFLQSECINFQMWVELPSDGERAAYLDFMNSYVEQQKALGRFERPLNNRLSDVMTWLENQQVVADDAQIMLWVALLFLLVCILNTIGLLLSKFSQRSSDVALRRAIGASRSAIFAQYLTETALIGVAGGIAGLGLTLLGLEGIKLLYGDFVSNLVALDIPLVIAAILLSVLASMLAGCYPAWRATLIAPASQLKTQ
ncbi:ABC transporter permease [Alteromonas halophila]|uniref:ABC transporter ATP-binding protein n=1 Tax=Alteromonas halophila TaxID=516698 RepID=A0A918JND4_9ALTE|nr:ABC transporter permease [Alteromonas halophila]GGW91260.1 ABC transporter ATP-binding protein [Alteromonas halophila]